jgi:hypothetical protein
MCGSLLRRPSPGLVLACVALFVALGGGAYAATSSDTKSEKKIAKKAAKAYFNANIGGASVSHANTANSATNATNATDATNAASATKAGTVYQQIQDTSTNLPTTGSGQSTVLTENVPAGTYLIIGTGTLNNNAASGTARCTCETSPGSDTSDQFVGTTNNTTNDDTTPWTNTLVHTFPAPETIRLSC